VDGDHPPAPAAGAGLAHRAATARDTEPGPATAAAGWGDRHGDPRRAGHGAGLEVDTELVFGEPPARGSRQPAFTIGLSRCCSSQAKWQLVLDMLDELAGWELRPPVLLADSGYGEVGEFRAGLDDRQIPYVVVVRSDTSAYPQQVRPTVAPHYGRGRRPPPPLPRQALLAAPARHWS
jgi:hypothetical protein